jgi:hypothetical protein
VPLYQWCLLGHRSRLYVRPAHRSTMPTTAEVEMAAYILIDQLAVTDRNSFNSYPDSAMAAVDAEDGTSCPTRQR